jgi:pimeloyl-ACP methyl ester carboxylesterase
VAALPAEERGEGPALLLLHAGIADRSMWEEHLEPLAAAGRRVVAVDLPGFGEAVSTREPVAHWEDVLETMDELGIEKAAIAGSSFGAAVALRLAALHPERVSSLLLFSAPAVPEPDPSPQLLAVWEAEEAALADGDVGRAVEAVVSAWVPATAAAGVAERIAAMQRANYERHASGPELEQAPDPLEEEPGLIAAIGCPVLLAAGEHDMADFRQAVLTLAQGMPATRAVTIRACGHLAPLEAPQEFRRLVLGLAL